MNTSAASYLNFLVVKEGKIFTAKAREANRPRADSSGLQWEKHPLQCGWEFFCLSLFSWLINSGDFILSRIPALGWLLALVCCFPTYISPKVAVCCHWMVLAAIHRRLCPSNLNSTSIKEAACPSKLQRRVVTNASEDTPWETGLLSNCRNGYSLNVLSTPQERLPSNLPSSALPRLLDRAQPKKVEVVNTRQAAHSEACLPQLKQKVPFSRTVLFNYRKRNLRRHGSTGV